jgi:uncharacterized membrane protein
MSDVTVGLILLIGAIIMLVVCLVGIVKVMQSLLGGQVAMMINKVVTYDFPRPFKFLGGYVCMVIAALIVVVVSFLFHYIKTFIFKTHCKCKYLDGILFRISVGFNAFGWNWGYSVGEILCISCRL